MCKRILILCCVLFVAITQTGCSGSFTRYLRGEYSGADGGVVAVSTGPENLQGYGVWYATVENVNSNERVIFGSIGANPFAGKPDFENSNREGGTINLRRLAPGTYRISTVDVKHGIFCSIVPVVQVEFIIKPNQITYIGSYWLRIIRTEEETAVTTKMRIFGLYTPERSGTITYVISNYSLEITDEWERDRKIIDKESPELMTMTVNNQVPAPESGKSAYDFGYCTLMRMK